MIYTIRPLEDDDRDFVRDAWLQSAASGFAYRQIPAADYKLQMRALIEMTLERCVVIGVADKSRPERIIGWSASEHTVDDDDRDVVTIHYVYVKHDWRKKGVGRALVSNLGGDVIRYSHANTTSSRIGPAKGWQYNPFTLWRH